MRTSPRMKQTSVRKAVRSQQREWLEREEQGGCMEGVCGFASKESGEKKRGAKTSADEMMEKIPMKRRRSVCLEMDRLAEAAPRQSEHVVERWWSTSLCWCGCAARWW